MKSYDLAKNYLKETGLTLEEILYWDEEVGYLYDLDGAVPFDQETRLSPMGWACKKTGTFDGEGLLNKASEDLWDKLNGELDALAKKLKLPKITKEELFTKHNK